MHMLACTEGGCELACAPEFEARVYADVGASAALPESRVRCPTTVASGAGPPDAPFAAAERAAPGIAQRLPNARYERCQCRFRSSHVCPPQEPCRAGHMPQEGITVQACGIGVTHALQCCQTEASLHGDRELHAQV